MLLKIDRPDLNFDEFRTRQPGELGFSPAVMHAVAEEINHTPHLDPEFRQAVGSVCIGSELPGDERIVAGWRLTGSRVIRPLSLLYLRVEQAPRGNNVTLLGSVILGDTCEAYGECADCVDTLQADVIGELNKDNLFGQGLMPETIQVLSSIGLQS